MNNNPNNDLNDFLNKSNQNLQDDFEKDAFEGFEMFDSKEEAFELKAALDKKIAPLFAEKKQNFRVIWYAAAGLILVIGLTVFFIQTNSDSIVKTKDVSMLDIPKKEMVEGKPEETETTAKMPNNAIPTEVESEKKLEKDKQSSDIISEAKKVEDKSAFEEVKKTGELSDEDRGYNQGNSKDANGDLDKMVLAKSTTKSGISANSGAGEGNINEEVNTKSSPVTVGGISSRETVKTQKENEEAEGKNFAEAETIVTNNKSVAFKENKDLEDKESDLKKSEKVASSKKAKERKKNRSDSNQPVSVTSEQSKGPEFYKNDDAPKTTIDAKAETNQCYYSGGETNLKKDVSDKLVTKNVNQKFDVVLFINENKKVEKVNFTNTFNLTVAEKQVIENELKTLNKFNFYINPSTKILFEFKLEYRP
ncbi:MAG: hypothetical protein SFY56_10765 [Bacteroidota bacterium]|nr:hypothetical protein [Bacteroidota bacterium]